MRCYQGGAGPRRTRTWDPRRAWAAPSRDLRLYRRPRYLGPTCKRRSKALTADRPDGERGLKVSGSTDWTALDSAVACSSGVRPPPRDIFTLNGSVFFFFFFDGRGVKIWINVRRGKELKHNESYRARDLPISVLSSTMIVSVTMFYNIETLYY